MRDTGYATEIATAVKGEARIEKIFIKAAQQEEIQFSWWRDGKLMMRPLDLPEEELLELLDEAFRRDVFSASFKRDLAKLIIDSFE